jgi:hypothetical protein
VDSLLARRAISLAERLEYKGWETSQLAKRARLAAARFQLLLRRPRAAAAEAQGLLAREQIRALSCGRFTYDAWIVLASPNYSRTAVNTKTSVW